MIKLIESITKDSFVKVKDNVYRPIAKVFYVTQNAPESEYVKIFMEEHFALVISPKDEYMYFGKDEGAVSSTFPTPTVLKYKRKKYRKLVDDYQIVKRVDFGDVLETEGEVEFIDYENESDANSILSVGLIVRTQKRADIVAEVIELNDITVLRNDKIQ